MLFHVPLEAVELQSHILHEVLVQPVAYMGRVFPTPRSHIAGDRCHPDALAPACTCQSHQKWV
jgi:hypothetical protein